MGEIIGKFVIDPGERVQCNDCGGMIDPKEGYSYVYILKEDNALLLFPRCEECAAKAEKED